MHHQGVVAYSIINDTYPMHQWEMDKIFQIDGYSTESISMVFSEFGFHNLIRGLSFRSIEPKPDLII